MAHALVVIVAAGLAIACCAGSASASVGPSATGAAPTQITPQGVHPGGAEHPAAPARDLPADPLTPRSSTVSRFRH